MSSAFSDDESTIGPMTSRGRDWPCLRQFIVFLENRVGSLHELLRRVERDDLKIVALSILDASDCAVARLIVDNFERAHELLTFAGIRFVETDVIGVLLPAVDQPHTLLLGSLMSAEVNVDYVYPMMFRRGNRGAVAIYSNDREETLRVLREQQFDLINEDDLLHSDEFY